MDQLGQLDYSVSDKAIGNILKRQNIAPASDRGRAPNWQHLITHTKDLTLARGFIVETLLRKTGSPVWD